MDNGLKGRKGGRAPFCVAAVAANGFCIAIDIDTNEAMTFTDEKTALEYIGGQFRNAEVYRLAEGYATAAVKAGTGGRSSLAVQIIRQHGQPMEKV